MWALIIGFLFAGGLVKFACEQKAEPTMKLALRRSKLVRLANVSIEYLTLNQAEDGMVLAREFHTPELEKRFRAAAEKLKTMRSKETKS
jgi:hypothetical protein